MSSGRGVTEVPSRLKASYTFGEMVYPKSKHHARRQPSFNLKHPSIHF